MAFVVMCQDWFFHPSEFFLIKQRRTASGGVSDWL
jgi:hypothetical protein